MAILQTDTNGVAVTDNSGNALLKTSGSVLKVAQGIFSGSNTTNGISFTDSNLTLSIAPSSASNKILILISTYGIIETFAPTLATESVYFDIRRTISGIPGPELLATTRTGSSSTGFATLSGNFENSSSPVSISYLDSPNTTSIVTYNLAYRSKFGGFVGVVNGFEDEQKLSTITLLEIVA